MPAYPFAPPSSNCTTCSSPSYSSRLLRPVDHCGDLLTSDDIDALPVTSYLSPTDLPTGDPNDLSTLKGSKGDHVVTDSNVWKWDTATKAWVKVYDFAGGTGGGTGGSYTLPAATALVLGGVKIGGNVTVAADGTISVAAPYVLPPATGTVLGGVKQGAGATIAADGTLTVPPYALPPATGTVLGGVKVGNNVTVAVDGTISVSFPPSMVFRGVTDARNAYPAGYVPALGDMWIASDAGVAHADWAGLTNVLAHALLIFDGANWKVAGDVGGNVKPDWAAAPGSADEILNKPKLLRATVTQTVPRILSGGKAWVSGDIAVPGAAVGDAVIVGLDKVADGLLVSGQVTAANVVRVTVANFSGAATTWGATNLSVVVQ